LNLHKKEPSMIKTPKKLIEVALPLDDINKAAAYEKLPGIGPHPRGLHLWWARRPFGAARAIIFSQMVNDPGGERGWGKFQGQTKEDAQKERERLFEIVRALADWKNSDNSALIKKARKEIEKSWCETCRMNKGKKGFDPDKLPAFHDPFAGGGAIPLEAQRLGLEAYASDLNPVAVMINKAMIEIPPKFAGKAPVNPEARKGQTSYIDEWTGAKGLAEDVRYYGQWMRDEAFKKIGHLYPQVKITKEMAQGRGDDLKALVGQKLTVIAWLWARTVKSPNPAFAHVDVPLCRSFKLSKKKGRAAWVEPVIYDDNYLFKVRDGKLELTADGTVTRSGGRCLMSDTAIPFTYIREEGKAGRIGKKLMAIVCEGRRGRIFISPTYEMEEIAQCEKTEFAPASMLPEQALGFRVQQYGMTKHKHLFTERQLVALTTLSDLVTSAREKIIADAEQHGWSDDSVGLKDGGTGITAYADAIAVYLAFAVDRCTDFNNSLTGWRSGNEKIMGLFNRQAIPMVWDFGEANIMAKVVGGFPSILEYQAKCIEMLNGLNSGYANQAAAQEQKTSDGKIISTDPPYYDNIGYADLSDFFYVWMRKALRPIFTDLFATMAVPKSEELVATPFRHGSRENAESFFLEGMKQAFKNLALTSHPAYPVSIYYAFKQDANTASTGWEIFLEAVIQSGFMITGTWPMRSEQAIRMVGMGTNSLASSIVLVCRRRPENASSISRRDFLRELKETMPEALEIMIGGKEGSTPIAPVDLAQAAIGPGMAVFSKYKAVLEADGSPMSVHDALVQINREIDEYFNAAEGDLDSDSRFCIDWFQQYGFKAAPFGEADVLARAKGTSVDGVNAAGVVESGSGKVRLLGFSEYPEDWDPTKDKRIPTWEATHHFIQALRSGGVDAVGQLLNKMRERTEPIRQLAYRLFTLCDRKGWAEEARAYNELICSWHDITAASDKKSDRLEQMDIF